MPKKVRELETELSGEGFENRGGKGSHRNWVHEETGVMVTISGKPGGDAHRYQERKVRNAIREVRRRLIQ